MGETLKRFRENCRMWYEMGHRTLCNQCRIEVWAVIVGKYGTERVGRHVELIKKIMDRHEEEVRNET